MKRLLLAAIACAGMSVFASAEELTGAEIMARFHDKRPTTHVNQNGDVVNDSGDIITPFGGYDIIGCARMSDEEFLTRTGARAPTQNAAITVPFGGYSIAACPRSKP